MEGSPSWTRRLCPRPSSVPSSWKRAAPMGMPPSAWPCRASATATASIWRTSASSSLGVGDICSGESVMSSAADRTYTTTVGSQTVELPLVAAQRRADHRAPHLRRPGRGLRRDGGPRAGRADATGPARDRGVGGHHGHPAGHRGQPRPGARRLRHPAQDAQDPPGRDVVRAGVLHHDRQAAAPAHGPGPGGRRARPAGGRGRRRHLHRRLAGVGPAPGPPHGRRARRRRRR